MDAQGELVKGQDVKIQDRKLGVDYEESLQPFDQRARGNNQGERCEGIVAFERAYVFDERTIESGMQRPGEDAEHLFAMRNKE